MDKIVLHLRRTSIVMKKRFELFKYNISHKFNHGFYDPEGDQSQVDGSRRAMNIFDFAQTRDLILLDPYSDASQFGGESQQEFEKISEPGISFCKNIVVLIMIQTIQMANTQFDNFNGIRITMRPPSHPAKLGLYINVSFREYEHYIGHLLDIQNPRSDLFQQYEIPLSLLTNANVRDKVLQKEVEETFNVKGLTFTAESTNETPLGQEIQMDIKQIDMIYNHEFEKMVKEQFYSRPVFFKSLPPGQTYEQVQAIDNGREIINYGDEWRSRQAQTQHLKRSINNFAFENNSIGGINIGQPAKDQQKTPSKLIKDRLNK
ncbi:UNKNOWN [Stylonychia lemnae]|uniref:Uncharacterized protein n=1 Tax=Stylonychia lemnae TaxID=5949 RepID=A0A078AB44_STYLE|nr:UNKNOWN [Stylonychia lemnae]|eukprot:CDW79505.1 UNKNOWN [Stylonychia lemnae]